MMLSVASSPSIVALPNAMPSITKSRRITMPARVDFVPDFLKLSATPSILIPFFSGWTRRAAGKLLYRPFSHDPGSLAVRLEQDNGLSRRVHKWLFRGDQKGCLAFEPYLGSLYLQTCRDHVCMVLWQVSLEEGAFFEPDGNCA